MNHHGSHSTDELGSRQLRKVFGVFLALTLIVLPVLAYVGLHLPQDGSKKVVPTAVGHAAPEEVRKQQTGAKINLSISPCGSVPAGACLPQIANIGVYKQWSDGTYSILYYNDGRGLSDARIQGPGKFKGKQIPQAFLYHNTTSTDPDVPAERGWQPYPRRGLAPIPIITEGCKPTSSTR